ncbi:MAG: ZIP family metal transporter [Thermoprotei archaeon]|nr:MAG: ZIP family metal transporter [Thermoprotei archaeon]
MLSWLETLDPLLLAVLAGSLTTALNAAGALPVLFLKKLPEKFLDIGLGFASGVMLAASFTSLILPGIELGGIAPAVLGILIGAYSVSLADHVIPHMHKIIGVEGKHTERLRAVWLFVIAVTLHNMPEGLAVGVGAGSGRAADALALAIAIGIQNIPEGLSIAFSLLSVKGSSRRKAFITSFLSGLVEFPLAIIGAVAVAYAHSILPYAMGFAGGAMIFVVSDEMIPETHRVGHERRATYGLIIGLVTMLVLDVVLG